MDVFWVADDRNRVLPLLCVLHHVLRHVVLLPALFCWLGGVPLVVLLVLLGELGF